MDVTFELYKKWIQKYINNHDTREINFQNDVVKRMFENLFPKLDIVCVDTKGSESKSHDYYKYSGKYLDVNGKEKPTTPDLLVCKDWDWYNEDNNIITYIATVEVKSPYGAEAVYKKDFEEYPKTWKTKIKRHLSAEKITKVIFTDTFKWVFFQDSYEKLKIFELVDKVPKGRGYTFKWKADAEYEFNKLKNYLEEYFKENENRNSLD